MASRLRKLAILGISGAAGAAIVTHYINNENTGVTLFSGVFAASKCGTEMKKRPLPTRAEQLESLRCEEFDVLIIGGGASGTGCALDATMRGLKTALVEMDDFSSGTSSRSTKLIHGGVRYLQKAIMGFDVEQYKMVKEALQERAWMINAAPFLNKPLPIMLPVYAYWQIPYFWVGIKAYDFVALGHTVKSSYLLSKSKALELFPMLKSDSLRGAIVYFDGQMDDARMNLIVALTSTRLGATVANHTKVLELYKDPQTNKLNGAKVRDELTGQEFNIKAKCIINCAGPMTDLIRKMDDCNVKNICAPSSGVHVVLPGYYSPDQMGLLDPNTSDGRVIFFLPWQNHTIAGTTDEPCEVTHNPKPSESDIQFILNEIKHYLNKDVEVRRGDVLSAWSGIRPLVSDPNKGDTQSIARNHIVHVSKSNLVTLAGGKWTTFRSMAVDCIDEAIKACNLKPKYEKSQTLEVKLEGSENWTPTMYIRLVQDFGLESEVAKHMSNAYGDRAFAVAKLACQTGKRYPIIGQRIHPEFPFIDAEIRYGIKEYACTAIDMIARRIRLAFLNVEAAQEALPDIVDIMAEELGWDAAEKKKQTDLCQEFLQNEMGQRINRQSKDNIPINLTKEEMQLHIKRFQMIDTERKGYVSLNDIRRSMAAYGEQVSGEDLHEILREIDTNMNGLVELDEYLQMMSAIKSGHVAYSRFGKMAEMAEQYQNKGRISPERSGGGL